LKNEVNVNILIH